MDILFSVALGSVNLGVTASILKNGNKMFGLVRFIQVTFVRALIFWICFTEKVGGNIVLAFFSYENYGLFFLVKALLGAQELFKNFSVVNFGRFKCLGR